MREVSEERGGGRRGFFAELRRNLGTLPNQLTASRLVLLPVLWALALLGEPVWLGIGVAVASATDMLDGYLSRRWNQTSAFGSRLDSAADHLLAVSTTLWLVLLVSWLKFRRMVNLHLYTSKAAVILAFLFAIPLLILGRYSHVQFYVTLAVCTLAAAESLAIILTRDRVDENIGSILRKRR